MPPRRCPAGRAPQARARRACRITRLGAAGCGAGGAPAALGAGPKSGSSPAPARGGGSAAPPAPASAAQSSSGTAAPTLTIAVVGNSPAWIPVWIGVSDGVFARYGVHVKLEVTSAPVAIAAVEKNDVQIAGDAAAAVQADPTGGKLAFVGALQNDFNAFTLYAKPGITSVKQLEGQTVASGTPAATASLAVDHWLVQQGVNLKAIHWLQSDAPPTRWEELQRGLVAASVITSPFGVQAAKGGFHLLADFRKLHLAGAATTFAVDRTWGQAHQEELEDFFKGLIVSVSMADRDKATAEKATAQYTHVQSKAQLDAFYARFAGTWPNPPFISTAAVAEAIRDVPSPVAKKYAPSSFIWNAPLNAVVASGFAKPYVGGAGAG
jgi:ABC-type nitrate/sulfonate/bicarbonate transport system substrate-binding protein